MSNVGKWQPIHRIGTRGARLGAAILALVAILAPTAWGGDAPTSATASYALVSTTGKTQIATALPPAGDGVALAMRLGGGPGDGARLAALVRGNLAGLAGVQAPATALVAWDGQAWTPWAQLAPGAPQAAWTPAAAVAAEKTRAEALLADLKANGGDAASESGKPLADLVAAEVKDLDGLASQDEFAQTTGDVKPAGKLLEGPDVGGIARPTSASCVLPYRVQVWLAPAGAGVPAIEGRPFTYHVQMSHARAGRAGAFYYVAYADSDGDGQPDYLIARSPLAMGTRDGEWTEWTFSSAEHVVFVGNAWLDGATVLSHSEADPAGGAWTGVSSEAHVAAVFCALPNLSFHKKPLLANLRYRVQP